MNDLIAKIESENYQLNSTIKEITNEKNIINIQYEKCKTYRFP